MSHHLSTTKKDRAELYLYIEELLKHSLTTAQKATISNSIRYMIKKHNAVYITQIQGLQRSLIERKPNGKRKLRHNK